MAGDGRSYHSHNISQSLNLEDLFKNTHEVFNVIAVILISTIIG